MVSPQPLILRSPIRLRQVVEPIVCFAISELYFHFLLVIGLCVAYCRDVGVVDYATACTDCQVLDQYR